jgi:hypothetical protein
LSGANSGDAHRTGQGFESLPGRQFIGGRYE